MFKNKINKESKAKRKQGSEREYAMYAYIAMYAMACFKSLNWMHWKWKSLLDVFCNVGLLKNMCLYKLYLAMFNTLATDIAPIDSKTTA